MVRGPKKHMKRLNAPKHWMLSKMGGIWAPKPTAGPHKVRECLPLSLIVRNRLKYALSRRESMMILMQKLVKIDGRVRTELNFPAGFMDVIEIPQSDDRMRLLYDTNGRFVLHKIPSEEVGFKLCRVQGSGTQARQVPYITTHDGRTIRYPDPLIKKHDVVKVDLATGKIVATIKFEIGNLVMCTKGGNTGRIGTLTTIEKHPGSFDIVHVKDVEGNVFATRLGNVFSVGKGGDLKAALISLPRGKGVKRNIFELRDRGSAVAKA
jgi:ribosomal protein S4E